MTNEQDFRERVAAADVLSYEQQTKEPTSADNNQRGCEKRARAKAAQE